MFNRVLVPLDGSTLAEQALTAAMSVARSCGASIELLLVHTGSLPDQAKRVAAGTPEEHLYMQALTKELAWRCNVPVSAHITRGLPAQAIVRRAAETNTDLIVMTSHGRTGFSRAWLGSVADGVVRHSTVPVLVERPVAVRNWREFSEVRFRKILIPQDGTRLAASVLRPALGLCQAMRARPVLARVVHPSTVDVSNAVGVAFHSPMIYDNGAPHHDVDEAHRQLATLALRLEAAGPVPVETAVVVNADVALGIIEMAGTYSADLIAMSTRSRGASRLVLGSVTDKVLRGTSLPLLLLHPTSDAAREVATLSSVALQPA